jgi:hypothetical protein
MTTAAKKVCLFYQNGSCRYGANCCYLHGKSPSKTPAKKQSQRTKQADIKAEIKEATADALAEIASESRSEIASESRSDAHLLFDKTPVSSTSTTPRATHISLALVAAVPATTAADSDGEYGF